MTFKNTMIGFMVAAASGATGFWFGLFEGAEIRDEMYVECRTADDFVPGDGDCEPVGSNPIGGFIPRGEPSSD